MKNVGLLHKYGAKKPATLNQQYFEYRKSMIAKKGLGASLKVSLTGRQEIDRSLRAPTFVWNLRKF